jgi:hypothetical protein
MYTGPQIVTSGLILHLDALNTKSYPGTGTTWYDRSGKGANGTLVANVSWNSGGWFDFDGVDDNIDGINIPQNYVDVMIGMYSLGGPSLEMVFSKFNDQDKSLRTSNGIFRHSGLDGNDWNYQNTQYDWINGVFISGDTDLKNRWTIVRSVNQNTNFGSPFVYSLSSDFLSRRYKGRIAFVLCYDRILSSSEINQNYNALKSRFGI